MILSTAAARPVRDIESGKVPELIPAALRDTADGLINFIQHYYEHLNSAGLPSYEINNITRDHDIDLVSAEYLDAIQGMIAKGVPNSKVLDRVSLYKKIVKYYATRGSEESAITFFRIFFDEIVDVFYPKDFLFATSSGAWDDDSSIYEDRKGFVSDVNKIQDGTYWQAFSYEIQSARNINEWQDAFIRLVHPAGLKLFAALILALYRSNYWVGDPDGYYSLNPTSDIAWINAFTPPGIVDGISEGFFLPTYQPGWLSGNDRRVLIFLNGFLWANQNGNPEGFDRLVLVAIKLALQNLTTRNTLVREEYQGQMKFFDTGNLRGFADKTLGDAIAGYDEQHNCDLLNISAQIRRSVTWDYSLIVTPVDAIIPDGWEMSGHDDTATVVDGEDYEDSSYEDELEFE